MSPSFRHHFPCLRRLRPNSFFPAPFFRHTRSLSIFSSSGAMARGSALLDGSVLPPSRIVSEKQAGLPRRFMPESATGREIVMLGEGRPAPDYPGRSVFFLPFAMAGLVPPFSSFFMDVLEFYDLQMAHLTPNAVMTLGIFAHLCEMFIGVRPSLRLFRWFFTVQSVSPPSVVGGCYFLPRGPVLNRYIPCVLRKKWDD